MESNAGWLSRNRGKVLLSLVALLGLGYGGWKYLQYRSVESHWDQGQQALQDQKLIAARKHLKEVVAARPTFAKAHLLLGRIARQLGELSKANHHLALCSEHGGQDWESYRLERYMLRAQEGEILKVIHRLQPYMDQEDSPFTNLSIEAAVRGYLERASWTAAQDLYDIWVEKDPDSIQLAYCRGLFFEAKEVPDTATVEFQKALAKDPERYDIRHRLAKALLSSGKAAEGVKHILALPEEVREKIEVLERLGNGYISEGQLDKAEEVYKRMLTKDPENDFSLSGLGIIAVKREKIEEAEHYFREALKRNPMDYDARFYMVRVARRLGRTEEASRLAKEFSEYAEDVKKLSEIQNNDLKNRPNDPFPPAEIGRVLMKWGAEDNAGEWLELALRLNPRHEMSHRILADYYQRKGDAEKAALHRKLSGMVPTVKEE